MVTVTAKPDRDPGAPGCDGAEDPEQAPAAAEGPLESQPEPPVRGQALFRAAETLVSWVEARSRRVVPDEWNPLLHSGAVANTLLITACVTGVLLLVWYSPSVHLAHASMRAMEAGWLSRLVRAAHRYSSDGCMAFTLWHALRLASARRFTGARWLAWVTGGMAVGLLWAVGWLGYWLVWDETAREIALVSARAADVLPIFNDPMSREFVADATVNSLLFFVVFFVHMLLPLGMGIALWLHIARLARPEFLAARPLALALVLGILALSAVLPPVAAAPALMAVVPGRMALDAWYLWPLLLFDASSGGRVVAWTLAVGIPVFAAPWLLARARRPAANIVTPRCNACEQCVKDCPYDAIAMVPRDDERRFPAQARVDPSRCLSCGICVGSCHTGAATLPHYDMLRERARLEQWSAPGGGAAHAVAFLCHDAVPPGLRVDEDGHCNALPGYRACMVPCAGWVQAITVSRLLRRGATHVLIVGCGGVARFREGMRWTRLRIADERDVGLHDRRLAERVRIIEGNPRQVDALRQQAAAFLAHRPAPAPRAVPRWAGAVVTACMTAALLWGGSVVSWAPRKMPPRLAVSFRHPGAMEEQCRRLSQEEQARRPPHMRRDTECERRRQPVRLEVFVDGQRVHAQAYPPHGLWGDGASVGLESWELPAGHHDVMVRIGDGADPDAWPFVSARRLELKEGVRPAVVFDRASGFTWYPGPP
ncbi:MAG: 4Fe-4S dicluster domain-containing protein [Deltaproteobacteria bacterium]|nr:4Fe-4S dicluster domain-containing protein [Deltaproteobacteria bacterium]